MQKYWEEKEREWNILIKGVQFTTEEIWWIRLVDQYKGPFYMNGKNSSCQFLHSDIACDELILLLPQKVGADAEPR